MKLFDRFEGLVFKTVNRIFGEIVPATWVSVDETVSYTGTVLFSAPSHKETLDQIEFTEIDPYFEYLAPAFPGLKLMVEAGNNEIVNISGVDYYVTSVMKISDGNTFKASVQLVDSEYGASVV